MKRRIGAALLGLEAICCALLAALNSCRMEWISELPAFPLAQIGALLRGLSLSSSAGNVVAVVLFALAGLLPLLLLLPACRSRHWEDVLPCLLCPMVWLTLYGMINPGIFLRHFGALADPAACRMLANGGVLSALVAYLVLRLLRNVAAADTGRLLRMASLLLRLCLALFIFCGFYLCVRDFAAAIVSLREGNTSPEVRLGPSYIFLILQLLVSLLPHLGDIWIVLAALRLVEALRTDRPEAAISSAELLSGRCIRVLSAVTLSGTALNLLQLVFAPSLQVFNSRIDLPLISILLALTALLAARLIRENKRLRDDNELFI